MDAFQWMHFVCAAMPLLGAIFEYFTR